MSNAELIAEARSFLGGSGGATLLGRLADALEEADAKIAKARDQIGHYSTCRSVCSCTDALWDVLSGGNDE